MIKVLIAALFLSFATVAHAYDAVEHQRDRIISDIPPRIAPDDQPESSECARAKTPESASTQEEIAREAISGEVRPIPNYPADCPSENNQRYEA